MAKTSAPGLGLQRFIECTLCDIADGYLGARAIVNSPRQDSTDAQALPPVGPITVSFDLVVGHGEGREAVRVLNGAEVSATDSGAVSRIRFKLPLNLPGPLSAEARPAVPEPQPELEPEIADGTAPEADEPDDPQRAKVQDPEDLALM